MVEENKTRGRQREQQQRLEQERARDIAAAQLAIDLENKLK
jgi:hypothetical protein